MNLHTRPSHLFGTNYILMYNVIVMGHPNIVPCTCTQQMSTESCIDLESIILEAQDCVATHSSRPSIARVNDTVQDIIVSDPLKLIASLSISKAHTCHEEGGVYFHQLTIEPAMYMYDSLVPTSYMHAVHRKISPLYFKDFSSSKSY